MRIASYLLALFALFRTASTEAQQPNEALPLVPDGFVVDVVAREPFVRNPCVMAFDHRGRLFVGQGPQWRAPTPETPGDRVDLLLDDDGDGAVDRVKTFAEGFNNVQGLAWYGDTLWVANAPDLTIVRDLDGDDEADEYVRLYTGVGNLEHSLHGLNVGPDGRMYMSKGNSKGYNRPDQLAPRPFRELWGLPSPPDAPDFPTPQTFTKATYQRSYHTPQDDWGQQGGILRCDPDGQNLEIVSRGFRNPWDIAYDDAFNWLGTDNDQSAGDRIFSPFLGANFGWGHPWSFSWTGEDHFPTVPISAPPFEGSGTGVAYYHAEQFPPEYRNVFFIGDWLKREIVLFRPRWDGALMVEEHERPNLFAHADGGRTLPQSDGRVFDPTDLEVGPDGALYVLSWGHSYGAILKDGRQLDAGRVYRIRYAGNPLTSVDNTQRAQPYSDRTLDELLDDLGSSVASFRVEAQRELLRRGDTAAAFLLDHLQQAPTLSRAQITWMVWTLARADVSAPLSERIDNALLQQATNGSGAIDHRIQAVRTLAWRLDHGVTGKRKDITRLFAALLDSEEPRIRFATIQGVHEAEITDLRERLLAQLDVEQDRIVFYAAWNALRSIMPQDDRANQLDDDRAGVRLGMLLGLLADDEIDAAIVLPLRNDPDSRVARIAEEWLLATGAIRPLVTLTPQPGTYAEPIEVALETSLPDHRMTYTTDGSTPSPTSPRYQAPLTIDRTTTLKIAVLKGNDIAGRVQTVTYRIEPRRQFVARRFIHAVSTPSGRPYEMDDRGLAPGKRQYTDRDYRIVDVPIELQGLPFLRTANNDDRSSGNRWLTMTSDDPVTLFVGVDARNPEPLAWMRVNASDGYQETGLEIVTTDATFRMYRKEFPAGEIVLGGNTNSPTDSGRGNYLVAFERQLLRPDATPATLPDVLAALPEADPERGRELFLHNRGAGCAKCHALEGVGQLLAPDLSDLGNRAKSPEAIVTSILDPSAVITEGFAQQQIATVDGRVLSGAVIEETGLSLKLVTSEGTIHVVRKAEIEARLGTKLSPMPAGFGRMMSATQVADITAWLLTQKVIGDREGFSFKDEQDRLEISYAGQRIATYLKEHEKLTRPAFVNVRTPGGLLVTRNFPPQVPEDIDPGYQGENGIIHPVMHAGIWISYGDLNGNDYWRLQSRVAFDGYVVQPTGTREEGSFTSRHRYLDHTGEKTVCTETVRYQLRKVDAGILLGIEATYLSEEEDFYFGDQEESGLAVRVASPLRVTGGNGTILNNRGERNGTEIWGKPAKWFDYFGVQSGREVGLMVVSSPANPRPSWLHARDYGVVATNPFPKQPKERREPYIKTWVRKGEPYRLSYAVLIHDRPANQPLDREAAAQQALNLLAP